ncbi:putative metallophosphatase protein [Rhizobium phage RHph_TM39]|nr:putative metallophosphatase protein [Rhizobium phage RHph_TM39]
MEFRRFIGDVHGKYSQYKKILKESPYPTIQVGDMGVGFYERDRVTHEIKASANPPYDLMVKAEARFERGNHDNPRVCKNHTQWIPDGHTETIGKSKVMFIGGGLSIDRGMRIEGESWWPDEELSMTELYDMVDKYAEYRPDVMVTHDCPDIMAAIIFGVTDKGNYPSRTRQAFQSMFEIYQPKLWIFGHWHRSARYHHNGTKFICLAELEYLDIEL